MIGMRQGRIALRILPLVIGGMLLLALGGCGGDSTGVDPGCYAGDAVPDAIRENLEAEAGRFFERVRSEDLKSVYQNAAAVVREQRSEQEFLGPIVRSVRTFGLPEDMETLSIHVLHFGRGFPYRKEAECRVGGEAPTVFTLTGHRVQASMVQRSRMGSDLLYYSTLWLREDEEWRLGAFLVKLASIQGKDWEGYAEEAAVQKDKGNSRNAALLYNVAIDLLVPNAWTRPGDLAKLQLEQRRISVSNLPLNQIDPWPAGADTFRVFHSAYTLDAGQLALVFRYQSPFAMEDSVAVKDYSDRLRDYVTRAFPEYAEVFPRLVLVAAEDPGSGGRARINSYPLGRAP